MARVIEIRDLRPIEGGGRVLAFDLIDLLRIIEPEGRDLAWAAFGLDVEGAITIPHEPWRGRKVTPMGWAELRHWAADITQVIWGTFIGGDAIQLQDMHPAMDSAELYDRCAFVIEAIDSGYWRVYAWDDTVVERVSQSFTAVRECPVPVGNHAALDDQ